MSEHARLSKKLFMSLKPGQYIMDNYLPQAYEKIGENLDEQWLNWRGKNGNKVYIYDSKEECLRDWWSINSASEFKLKSKAVFFGKMSKELFFKFPVGYYILFTQGSHDYYKLSENREDQWLKVKHRNSRVVEIFRKEFECVMRRNEILDQGVR